MSERDERGGVNRATTFLGVFPSERKGGHGKSAALVEDLRWWASHIDARELKSGWELGLMNLLLQSADALAATPDLALRLRQLRDEMRQRGAHMLASKWDTSDEKRWADTLDQILAGSQP
jgi:hypothetical protein